MRIPAKSDVRSGALRRGALACVISCMVAGGVAGCSGGAPGTLEGSLAATGPAPAPKELSGLGTKEGSSAPASDAADKAAAKLTSAATPGSSAYKIGPLDVLEISVFKVPDLSKAVQVADAGTVNLPLVGEVQAVGRTSQELERDLTKQLGEKYLQNPQVTVYVKEYNSQRVTIEGAVRKPGVYPIRGKSSLLQFIATAEGLQEEISDSTVVIFRSVGSKRQAARFDVSEIRSGTADDPEVQAGDVIVAGKSAMKETFNTIMKAAPIAGVFAWL